MDSIRFFRDSFWNSSAMKVLGSLFFELDAFLWSRLFPGLELEDFHGFHQVFCVSFRNSSARNVLVSWFFGLDASLKSKLFPGLELTDFHGFHQVFSRLFQKLMYKEGGQSFGSAS